AIGRETNYTDEAGVLNEPEYTTFRDPARDRTSERTLTILRATARKEPHAKVAHALGLSESALRRYLKSGRLRATTQTRTIHNASTRHPCPCLGPTRLPPRSTLSSVTPCQPGSAALPCNTRAWAIRAVLRWVRQGTRRSPKEVVPPLPERPPHASSR